MKNYLKLKSISPFTCKYVYMDTDEYLADQLFIKHKVKVRFGTEFSKDGMRIIKARINKKDESAFIDALNEMYDKTSLLEVKGYKQACLYLESLAL